MLQPRSTEFPIEISYNKVKTIINTKDIAYIESSPRRLEIHCSNGEVHYCSAQLTDFFQLMPIWWERVHQSFAINLECIKEVSVSKIKMNNGDVVPISRRYVRQAAIRINNYNKVRTLQIPFTKTEKQL